MSPDAAVTEEIERPRDPRAREASLNWPDLFRSLLVGLGKNRGFRGSPVKPLFSSAVE